MPNSDCFIARSPPDTVLPVYDEKGCSSDLDSCTFVDYVVVTFAMLLIIAYH